MKPLTEKQLKFLRALAEKATDGPWSDDDGNIFSDPLSEQRYEQIMRRLSGENIIHPDDAWGTSTMGFIATTNQQRPNFEADAEYIAAANPSIMLNLLNMVENLRKELADKK